MSNNHSSFTERGWEDYAICYDSINHLLPYQKMLADVVSEIPKLCTHLLDAACGTGNLETAIARSQIFSGLSIAGVDASQEMLKRARAKIGTEPNISFSFADLNSSLSFQNESFDCVTSINTMYAIKDPRALLDEFHRVLKKGGTLIIVTPKLGCQNGVILKDHCGSKKPDEYWFDAHSNEEREVSLIHEAITDKEIAKQMIRIGMYNRHICSTARFHFFKEADLIQLLRDASFSVSGIKSTYGRQAHFVIATAD